MTLSPRGHGSRSSTVAVIGGGAAGLFFARIFALQNPRSEVVVYERLPPNETFGFGVGLTGALMKMIHRADPELHDDIVGEAFDFSAAEFRLPSGSITLGEFHRGVAIARAQLLQLLIRRAQLAGVEVRLGCPGEAEQLRGSFDLVVAADGASSLTRETFADAFGSRVDNGRGVFIWCGSETELPGTVFMPVNTEHGVFVTHAYPYAAGRSGWVIETDENAWRQAGLAEVRLSDPTSPASDERSLAYLSQAFREPLGGHPLVGNKSRWAHFRTVRCARWSHENVVLIGDAAATAHPSLGSGTKHAMESALALATALRDFDGTEQRLQAQLAVFEAIRRAPVERLQERARRSQLWWESFPTRTNLTPARMAVSFLTRAGVVSLEDLARSEPFIVSQATAEYAGTNRQDVPSDDLAAWVLGRPCELPGETLPSRLVDWPDCPIEEYDTLDADCEEAWGEQADALLARARAFESRGAIVLAGNSQRTALLNRLALGERIRNELNVAVVVTVPPAHVHDAADALVAGRADLIAIV